MKKYTRGLQLYKGGKMIYKCSYCEYVNVVNEEGWHTCNMCEQKALITAIPEDASLKDIQKSLAVWVKNDN